MWVFLFLLISIRAQIFGFPHQSANSIAHPNPTNSVKGIVPRLTHIGCRGEEYAHLSILERGIAEWLRRTEEALSDEDPNPYYIAKFREFFGYFDDYMRISVYREVSHVADIVATINMPGEREYPRTSPQIECQLEQPPLECTLFAISDIEPIMYTTISEYTGRRHILPVGHCLSSLCS